MSDLDAGITWQASASGPATADDHTLLVDRCEDPRVDLDAGVVRLPGQLPDAVLAKPFRLPGEPGA